MIDSKLYSTEDLDHIIHSRLKGVLETLSGYVFEGASYNKLNFNRSLVFYDEHLFEEASLGINPLNRWINAYYWYSVYLNELKKQHLPIDNHMQPRFKVIEQIDHYASPDFDWSIIEKMDAEFDLKL